MRPSADIFHLHAGRVQQFVGQAAGQLGHHLGGVGTVGQLPLGLAQLLIAQALGLLPIGAQHVHRGQFAQALHELGDAAADQFLGGLGSALAALEILRHYFVEVVDAIEVDVVQFADFRLDVARHGDVDHEHRLVLALLQRALHGALAEDRQLAGSGADDDIAVGQLLGYLRKQHRMGAELLGEQAGALQGAVGHHDALHALLEQVARDQGDGLAGADQQRLAAVQVAEDLLGQAHRGERHGHRVLADGGIGADGLRRTEGGLEQAAEQRTDGAGLARDGVGRLHLAEDLRLAEDHRVEAGGHAHHVAHRVFVLVHIGTGAQLVESQAMVVRQPGEHVVRGRMVDLQVEFAPVAGRQDGRLAAGGQAAELLQRLDHLFRSESHALADSHRGGLVIDAEGNEGHAGSLS